MNEIADLERLVAEEETLVYDHGSERAVLACVMRDPSVVGKIRHTVAPEDFQNRHNRSLYAVMVGLYDREIKNKREPRFDPSALLAAARAAGKERSFAEKVGGVDYLTSVKLAPVEIKSLEVYVEAVKLASAKSSLHRLGRRIQIKAAGWRRSASEMIGDAERDMSELAKLRECAGIKRLGDSIDSLLRECDANRKSGSLGIHVKSMPKLMSVINGLRRKQFIVLFARPKVGKSAFMLNVGIDVACHQNYPVLYIDTEMDDDEQLSRAMSNWSNVPEWDILSGRFKDSEADTKSLETVMGKLRAAPFYYYAARGVSTDEIIYKCREFVDGMVGKDQFGRTNKCLIVYDWLKVMSEDALGSSKEYQQLGFIATKLNEMLKILDVPVLVGAQANRDGAGKNVDAKSAEEAQKFLADSDRLLRFCTCLMWLRRLREEELARVASMPEESRYNQMIHILDQRRGPAHMKGIPLRYMGATISYKEMQETVDEHVFDEPGAAQAEFN